MSMPYSHVLEEQEHLGAADLDSCPDCSDAMVSRGDEKICAGCGTRQPVITVQAKQDWAFVARMSAAVDRHWEKKAMDDFADPAFTPGTEAFAIEQYATELGPEWNPTDSEPGEWLEMTNIQTGETLYITPDGIEDSGTGTDMFKHKTAAAPSTDEDVQNVLAAAVKGTGMSSYGQPEEAGGIWSMTVNDEQGRLYSIIVQPVYEEESGAVSY